MKKDVIKELIKKSSNNFHYQVVDFLRSNGWFVLVSPYYNDNLTDKPREIDIVAEKKFDVREIFNEWLGTLNIRLFIECKYISKPIVFWFDKKNKEKAIQRIVGDTPLHHPKENIGINGHHYLIDTDVAKLFSSTPDRSSDSEIIYKAINQSLNAMIYYKNTPSILPEEPRKAIRILGMINYPLILCNDFNLLYKVDSTTKDGYSEIKDKFQLEVDYVYLDNNKSSKSEYFIIDVVDFCRFDEFFKKLEETDIAIIKEAIIWEKRTGKNN